jgi:hypothetical protein
MKIILNVSNKRRNSTDMRFRCHLIMKRKGGLLGEGDEVPDLIGKGVSIILIRRIRKNHIRGIIHWI